MNWWALKQKVHTSWLLAIAAVGIVVGVWAASHVTQGWFAPFVWCVCGGVLLVISFLYRFAAVIPLCVIGGLFIGLWRGSVDQEKLRAYEPLFGATVRLKGVVAEDADQTANGQMVVRMKAVQYDGTSLPGTIWVTLMGSPSIHRSDHVVIGGKAQQGFGNFAAVMYRASVQNVERPHPGDVALAVRDWFAELVRKVVPEPEASLGLGYLLGQRRSLPTDLSDALRVAGLTHVIVASGYNLTILVRLARRLFMRISRFSALAAAGGMVLSFIAVTGMSPSMARAGLVTGLSLLAWYYGRKVHPLVLLPFAAAVTVVIQPSYAWGDMGWQLSFAAFGGVMILAPLLQAYFFGNKKPGVIRQIMGETVSAQIATLPILIVGFGYISNVALIANLLVLPLVPLAMLLVFMTGISVWLVAPLGALLALPTEWLLSYMTHIATWLSGLPWAQSELQVGGWFIVVYYIILTIACWYMWRATRLHLRDSAITD
jgi:competence protein ComEC